MEKKYTKPPKPILHHDLHCSITLTSDMVDISGIKDRAKSEGFVEQESKHITIIGDDLANKIKKLLGEEPPSERLEKLDEFKKLLDKLAWEFKPTDLYHITREKRLEDGAVEKREAYIRLIDMPDIERLYASLTSLFPIKIPIQFPHITLFTKGEHSNAKYKGIAVPSEKDFKNFNPKKIRDKKE